MNPKIQKLYALFLTSLLVLGGTAAGLAQNTPGYNNIPKSILTPDHVKTPIGGLNFFDGMPDKATVRKLYDNLLFMRGVEAFLSGIPATSSRRFAWVMPKLARSGLTTWSSLIS